MAAPKRIEIPRFPGNKRLAFTTSFDDGVETDRRVLDFFNQHGLKATWNLNSGALGTPHSHGVNHLHANEVARLYAGHEVAIHTVTHPHLPRLDASQIVSEVLDDRRALEDLVGYPVRGMAYPCGTYDRRVVDILRTLGIVYARTVENREPCFPPDEPLAWPSTAHQFHEGLVKKWQEWYASDWFNGVFFVWGHTYEFNDRQDWNALEHIFKPFAGKPDVWYCTNIELFDYEKARHQIVIAANRASAYNPTAKTITLLADGKPFAVPPGATMQLS